MSLRINDLAPDFNVATTVGNINFHEWIGNSWALLFSHPKDFTPVCTTELGALSNLTNEFNKRNCKIIGLSVDSIKEHLEWIKDIEELSNKKLNFPLIADENLLVAKLYNMLPAEIEGKSDSRNAQDNLTVRSVFLIDPEKKIRMMLTYPMTTGRNFEEIIRVLDSVQLTSKHKVATPANWKKNDKVIIVPAVSDEDAKDTFGDFEKIKPYLRYTKLDDS